MTLYNNEISKPRYWRYFKDGPDWDFTRKEYRFDLDSPYTIYSGVNKWPEYKVYPQGLGKKYCSKCVKSLYSYETYVRNGINYCDGCFHNTFSPKCTACFEPIRDNVLMRKVNGKPYHAEHVQCVECKVRLFDNFKMKDGRLYCDIDYHRYFSKVCAGCDKPVRQAPLYALGKSWHRGLCFRCDYCFRNLDETNYMSHLGKIYCKYDWARLYSTRCKGCTGTLTTTDSVYAIGGYFHPACFTCSDCYKKLNETSYKELYGKAYCSTHYHIRTCKECSDSKKSPAARSLSVGLHSLRSRSSSPSIFNRPKSSLA